MSNADQESWSRVKERLRAEVGDDVYSSWFARMDLEAIEDDGEFVHQRDIEVALGVFDNLRGFGHLDRAKEIQGKL